MNRHVEQLRFMLAEWFISKALMVIPPQTQEARELAIFIRCSWIGRLAKGYEEVATRAFLQGERLKMQPKTVLAYRRVVTPVPAKAQMREDEASGA